VDAVTKTSDRCKTGETKRTSTGRDDTALVMGQLNASYGAGHRSDELVGHAGHSVRFDKDHKPSLTNQP
jgi:hypothetical protein